MTNDPGPPCPHALLAATLALMTAYAEPNPDARVDPVALRRLLARKIVSNLFFLREHPALGASMRQVVGTVHGRWVAVAGKSSAEAPAARQATLPEREALRWLH
jgi:hypothetical protein